MYTKFKKTSRSLKKTYCKLIKKMMANIRKENSKTWSEEAIVN